MSAVSLIILAAGFSQRFGAENKLLAKLDGSNVLAKTLGSYDQQLFKRRILVVNEKDGLVASSGRRADFSVVANTQAQSGMGSSIAAGAAALGNSTAVMIALGDMPYIQPMTIKMLIDAFDQLPSGAITAPTINGKRGHPVIFSQTHFSALKSLKGDRGANHIVQSNLPSVVLVPINDPGIFCDIDTPQDLNQ